MGRRVGFVLDCMGVAEEVIAAVGAEAPATANRIWFMALVPPELISASGNLELYRAHALELCRRMLADADVRPATAAEVLCGMSRASLKAPPDAVFAGLMERLFFESFGHYVDAGGPHHREPYKGAYDALLADMRRKLGPQDRGAE